MVNDRLTVGRQIGAMLSGEALSKRFSYATSVFNGNNVNTSFNDNDKFLYAERASEMILQTKVLCRFQVIF